MTPDEDASFREFARAKTVQLRRTAYLLCGDWHLAEDLVQTTLIKLYRVWSKAHRGGPVDNYSRRILVRCWFDEQRKPWRRKEKRDGQVPEVVDARVDPAAAGLSDHLVKALAELTPRQRATVVLRYCNDLPVAEVAAVLGCSEGTVKSQTARGLDALRAVVTGLDVQASATERSR
ncbi:SigE family RNA polymerase sigma factor [Labedaea rhizosphaerae]|uniref:RNA polymerase sigma-70 factor (Sigma-E family) n=1 Tax=Labedaea rhizosphaerae TaxID=598644 RepID=A0A4R6SB93_LABRH|nr:SigE family RNA polymerase sigma factor [Labedaea rhizosphaerae]TDP96256.1 RNA polymerase sigma-70 factor (sigma-E family) [Labedaea rhizosphaerae]